MLIMGCIAPRSGGTVYSSAFFRLRDLDTMSSAVEETYVEIRASSMVPADGFAGHDDVQNPSAHSLVGVACGCCGYERRKKKVLIL